jgi:YgiT-type zinc finger domain-containing protein
LEQTISPKEISMKCVICRNGESTTGSGTVTLQRNERVLVIRKVPAQVCANCGEEYFDEDSTTAVLGLAEKADRAGAKIAVRDYLAA